MPEIRSISDSLDSCYKTISAILNIFGIELLPLDLSHFNIRNYCTLWTETVHLIWPPWEIVISDWLNIYKKKICSQETTELLKEFLFGSNPTSNITIIGNDSLWIAKKSFSRKSTSELKWSVKMYHGWRKQILGIACYVVFLA